MTHQQLETVEQSLSELSASDKLELVERLVRGLRFSVATDPRVSPRPATPLTEEEFKQQLLNSGLMTSLPTPPQSPGHSVFQPVLIEGEPLSETIIRERR